MPIPIKQFKVWQVLYDRLKLEPQPIPQQPRLSELIQPMTDIFNQPRTLYINNNDQTVSSIANKAIFTVPSGKNIKLHGIVSYLVSGTYTMSYVTLTDGTNYHRVAAVASNNVIYNPPHEVSLNSAWRIEIEFSAYTGSGTLRNSIYYEEQDNLS